VTTTLGTSDNLPISVQIPGYRLRRHVGTDATGLWFDCVQESLDRKLTLKTMRPEFEGRDDVHQEMLAEMDRLAGLEHPNLLRLIDTRRETPPAIIVERIGGRTLARLLDDDGPVKWETAVSAIRDAALALDHLHGLGLTHKNPSPALIAINDSGVARLVTFRNIVPMEEVVELRGKLVSDPNYIAPEQLAGDKEIGAATSVYQLGALLFHLLAGAPPHVEEDAKQTALAHYRKPFPALKGKRPFLPNSLYDLVGECTARDPADRPALADTAERLEDILEGRDTSGSGTAPRARRRRRRR